MNALDLFAEARPDVDVDDDVLAAIAADVFGGRTNGGPRWRVLGVAAAVIALIAGLAFVVGRPERTAPADTVPPAIPDGEQPLAMLPADMTLWSAIGGVSRPIDDPLLRGSAVIARSDGNGGYSSPVTVRRGPSDTTLFRVGGFESDATSEPVELTEDRRGELVTDPAAGQLIVQFELGDGTAVSVGTGYREPMSGERSRALQIAAGVSFLEDDDAAFASLPDGFEIVAPWRLEGVRAVRWASFFRTATPDEGYTVNIAANPDPVLALRTMTDDIAPVRVRGTEGFVSTRRFVGRDDVQALTVMWQEQPGQWVTIDDVGPSISETELLEFAESLRVVGVAEWDRVVEPIEDAAEVPATTAPAVALPGSVPPATTAPQTAPPGRLLVANAAGVGGVAGQWSTSFEVQGADVLEPANAITSNGEPAAVTRVYARPGFEALGAWVAEQFGVVVEPFDALDPTTVEGEVGPADVVVVVGLANVDPVLLGGPGAPLVIGNSVTMGAEVELTARGYVITADVGRLLVDVVPWIREAVEGARADVLVLQLADNGPFRRSDLDALLDAVSDVPNVILVNTHVDREWAAPNNALLAEVDVDGDNLILMDWDALADQCPGDCFAADGVHLTDVGGAYFVERLADITGY